ncbi:MAG: DUF1801 domain-containing protein [bacterium]|nr:DUF1801 domain-containing protein [bacterium]
MAAGKRKVPGSPADIDAFLLHLDHPHKEAINRLRSGIMDIDPRIVEEIKWNAPSFKLDDHFATFKLHPPRTIQIVMHTGAKPKAPPRAFTVTDPHGLLKWPAQDRCVLTLQSSAQATELHDDVLAMVREWIRQLDP